MGLMSTLYRGDYRWDGPGETSRTHCCRSICGSVLHVLFAKRADGLPATLWLARGGRAALAAREAAGARARPALRRVNTRDAGFSALPPGGAALKELLAQSPCPALPMRR